MSLLKLDYGMCDGVHRRIGFSGEGGGGKSRVAQDKTLERGGGRYPDLEIQ